MASFPKACSASYAHYDVDWRLNILVTLDIRNLRSVENETLRIPHSRTTYYDRSFAVRSAREWNALPFITKSSESIVSLENILKLYLLTK